MQNTWKENVKNCEIHEKSISFTRDQIRYIEKCIEIQKGKLEKEIWDQVYRGEFSKDLED